MTNLLLTRNSNAAFETAPIHKNDDSAKTGIINKIVCFVKKIFNTLKIAFLYPFRFVGAKDWSIPGVITRFPKYIFTRDPDTLFGKGFHRSAKDLSKDEVKPYIKYGGAAAAAYTKNRKDWTIPFGLKSVDLPKLQILGLPKSLNVHDGYLYNPKSGIKALVSEDNSGEVIISFGAINMANSENEDSEEKKKLYYNKQMGNIISSYLGYVPSIFHEASQIVGVLKNHPHFQGKRIVLVGSCYGATLASYCGLKNNLEVLAFNPLGLGPGIQTELGQETLNKADQLIRNVTTKGDYTSNHKIIGFFDRIASLMGVKTLGSFGKRYQIPSSYKTRRDIHRYSIRHMMQKAGYKKTTRASELPAKATIFRRPNPFDLRTN